MSGKGGGSQTTTTTQSIDPQIRQLITNNVDRATGVANQPFQAYGGQLTAGLTPGLNEAIARAPGINGAGYDQLTQAQGGATGLLGYQPQDASANISKWANPYVTGVINASLGDIERQRQAQIADNRDTFVRAGAFGGSRQGVADALTNEAFDRNALNTVAALRQQGYDQASNLAQQDANRDLQGAGVRAGASSLLGQLAGQQQQMAMNGQQALITPGLLQQQNSQANLDALYNEFMRQQQYPYQGQSIINQSLGLLPQTGTTTQTSPRQSDLGGFGSLLSGAAGIAGLFSDERLKSDIETVGFDERGRRWATWRYNWEDERIRHFGLIAQEVAISDPDAVSVHESGYLVVDYSKLTRH